MQGHRFHTAILFALSLPVLVSSCVSNDHQEKLLVHAPVHVYRSYTPPQAYPGSDFIAVIGPKDNVTVVQVMRNRDYMAVKIRLNDGREGWVFSGEAIELSGTNPKAP